MVFTFSSICVSFKNRVQKYKTFLLGNRTVYLKKVRILPKGKDIVLKAIFWVTGDEVSGSGCAPGGHTAQQCFVRNNGIIVLGFVSSRALQLLSR